ncbi:5-oxopent-3-ene-1,2,5-tricarboxylate decarboxylase [Rhodococcus sp. SRB_17]|nr:5-oxopent-3-ene-1,2,5-tricarboxylate decarboxylase [Rhodococcus sp. SRB_17]
MKIAKVVHSGRTAFAVVENDFVRAVGVWHDEGEHERASDLAELDFQSISDDITPIPIGEVSFLPPIGLGAKVICLGVNYKAHIDEVGEDIPVNPALFLKTPDALVGHLEPIFRPAVSECFDFEGEIAVVIGKAGRHISRENALSHVFGYTIMMDGSIRDFQKHSPSAGKNFWKSGSLGPWIVTADEVGNWTQMRLETRLSGKTVQSTTADLMIYDIATAIEYISKWTPLAPGDIIATGTPSGVGSRRQPPLWMKAGDVIEVEVTPLGTLVNHVKDEV